MVLLLLDISIGRMERVASRCDLFAELSNDD